VSAQGGKTTLSIEKCRKNDEKKKKKWLLRGGELLLKRGVRGKMTN